MNIRQRLDASFDCLLQTFSGFGPRKIYGCLYVGQQVLASVLSFTREDRNLILSAFLLRNIPGDFRCADDLAIIIFDGRDGQRNDDQAAVLALTKRLKMFYPLSTSDTCQDFAFLALPICRNYDRNGL